MPSRTFMRSIPFNFQGMFAVFVLVAALWLALPISASAQVEVEVTARQYKLAGVGGYVYAFNVANKGPGLITFFAVTYSGSAPLTHIEPLDWNYSVKEVTDDGGNVRLSEIRWLSSANINRDYYIHPGRGGGFQFTVSEQNRVVSWLAQDANGPGDSASGSVAFGDPDEPKPDFVVQVPLTKGINMVSLPLNPKQPFTASSLANTLESTIVIRAESGTFQVYVRQDSVGVDFPIEGGKGYIVNLLAPKTFEVIGQPWGVPAAPSAVPAEPWAFVVTGHIVEALPPGATVRLTNPRTGQNLPVPVEADGTFVGAFVDLLNRRAVVAPGDRLRLELMDGHGQPFGEPKYPQITPTHVEQAYLRTTLIAAPQTTRLLQNFPNPFNPETWIPYQLARDAPVTIQIYDVRGQLIRQLELGHQAAGFYTSRGKAAYWDGRNTYGEAVASGSYWVHFRAGGFHAVRKVVVVK